MYASFTLKHYKVTQVLFTLKYFDVSCDFSDYLFLLSVSKHHVTIYKRTTQGGYPSVRESVLQDTNCIMQTVGSVKVDPKQA